MGGRGLARRIGGGDRQVAADERQPGDPAYGPGRRADQIGGFEIAGGGCSVDFTAVVGIVIEIEEAELTAAEAAAGEVAVNERMVRNVAAAPDRQVEIGRLEAASG